MSSEWSATMRVELAAFELDIELDAVTGVCCLIGRNGSGKSTTLRAIAGGITPSAGVIRLGDATVFDTTQGIDLPPEARGVGYVPSSLALFPHLDAADNVAFGLGTHDPAPRRRQIAMEAMERLGVAALAARSPRSLSGGEAQRVALARALVTEPRLLLLDEPLSALDVHTRREARASLAATIESTGTPALIATHDPRDVRALATTIVVLETGRIAQRGDADEVASNPVDDFVAELFA